MIKQLHTLFLVFLVVVLGAYIVHRQKDEPARTYTPNLSKSDQPYGHRTSYKVFTFDIPKELSFAGERVPLEEEDVMERFDREVHINTYWNSSTVFLLKRANRWFPQIEPILAKYGIPEDFKYLSVIESGLTNVTSPAGAKGFWQLMPSTARELDLEVNREIDQRYDPIRSTEAACQYLLKAYERFGSWTKAAASYNMGMYGLDRELGEQKAVTYYDLLLNEETSRYVFRILAIKEIMENPQKYGYMIPKKHLYEQVALKEVTVTETIPDLVDFALESGISYKTLKLYNPWLRKNKLTIKNKGKSYKLLIPEGIEMPEEENEGKRKDMLVYLD